MPSPILLVGTAFALTAFGTIACGKNQSAGRDEPTEEGGGGGGGGGGHNDGGATASGGHDAVGGSGEAGTNSVAGAGGVDGTGGAGGGGASQAPPRRRLVAGFNVSCALADQGGVVCWGPTDTGLSSYTAMSGAFVGLTMGPTSATESVCAVDGSGQLSCDYWTGRINHPIEPDFVDCLPTSKVAELAIDRSGLGDLAYLTSNGTVSVINLGSCVTSEGLASLTSVRRLYMASNHACALSQGGEVECWVPDIGPSLETTVRGRFVDIAVGSGNTCGLTTDGDVRCWDANGVEDLEPSHFAAQVSANEKRVIQIASDASGENLCALFDGGRVLCSELFQFGISGFRLPEGEQLTEIAVGDVHLCGLRADRRVLCVKYSCKENCEQELAPPESLRVAK